MIRYDSSGNAIPWQVERETDSDGMYRVTDGNWLVAKVESEKVAYVVAALPELIVWLEDNPKRADFRYWARRLREGSL